MLISIIIPIYNEEKTITKILEKINNLELWESNHNIKKEIIVVNDKSEDNSEKILKENSGLYSKLITNDFNKGKGYSVKQGLKLSQGDYILIQDADEEYDPNDYIKFINCAEKFNADLIIGSRFIYDKYTRSHNFLNKIGNGIITLLFNLFYNTTFTDVYCCYIFFKKNLINPEKLKSKGFEQHAEILTKIIKKGKNFMKYQSIIMEEL